MKSLARYSRFLIAAVALLIAFALSVRFSDRGLQFEVHEGGRSALASPEPLAGYNLAGAAVVNKVLLQIQEKYVDRTRINPNAMLVYALDEIQKTVPEVVITFDRPLDEAPTLARVQVNTELREFQLKRFESPWEMSFKLKEIFRFMQANLQESAQLKFSDIEYAGINGMLNTLDPHSVLLKPELYKEMQTQTGGSFGGLGIVIGVREGGLTVISPIEDTPASRAGVKTGDKITQIDDQSTVNMDLNDAVEKLRGEPGSQVNLWLQRKGWPQPKKLTLTRAIIKIESVESQLLSGRVGYVRIKNFQANTHSDLLEHLQKLKKKSGGINGLVLDLRNNPGGLLDQAIKISDTFLREGTIVSTVGFGNKLRDENKAHAANTEPDYPIVVLVDPGSASASEIVAGALKNHDRAVILGDTTFGKGSVQVIYDLDDGSALKLTIAQYLTPGDVSIQSVGIVPDIRLQPVSVDDKGVDLSLSSHITREADLDAHLDHSNAARGDKPAATLRYLEQRAAATPEGDLDDETPEEEPFKEDFPIRMAQRLLKAADTTWERKPMLKKVEPVVKQLADQELETIGAALGRYSVDWAAGDEPSSPKLVVTLSTDQPQDTVKAGDTVTITAKVTNAGDAPVYRLRAISEADNDALEDLEFVFGRLDPGQERAWTVKAQIPKHAATRADKLKLRFGAMNTDLDGVKAELMVNTRALAQPHFAFLYYLDDSQGGNGDGALQPGESVKMRLRVQNRGQGGAEKTNAWLRNKSEAALFLQRGRAEAAPIAAGGEHIYEFAFEVKDVPQTGLTVEVEIYDEVSRTFASQELVLPSSTVPVPVQPLQGALVLDKAAALTNSALEAAPVAAQAPAGARLKVTGRQGERLRVALEGGLSAWLPVSAGQLQPQGAAQAIELPAAALREPPVVEVDESVLTTSAATYQLKGLARDDKQIKDFYVYVYTQKGTHSRARKVAYQRGAQDKLPIDAQIPLEPGLNHIRLTIRDSDDMTTTRSVYVYKH
jgi:carboxyl-terminal processing protease